MFSTKAAMNRFHTLPESPQVLIFHFNQFGCCRFRNISQLTNYWQLPHSVIWSHVGSSPNLRYWCLDQTVQEGANLNSHRGCQGSSCTVIDVQCRWLQRPELWKSTAEMTATQGGCRMQMSTSYTGSWSRLFSFSNSLLKLSVSSTLF